MSSLNRTRLTAVTLAVVAFFCFGGQRLRAGDPIDFSGAGAKNTAPKGSKADEERLKALQKSTSPSILREGAPPDTTPSITNPRDTHDDRRQRLAREERKYFLLYEPGELQKKDRESKTGSLGDYSLGGRDDKSAGRNWLVNDTSGANKAAANRKDNRSEDMENRARQADDDETDRKKGDRSGSSGQSGRESQAGAHATKDAEFKDLLNSTQARGEPSSSFDKADFALRDILGAPETSRSRAQETRMDNFRQLLNGTPANSSLGTPKDAARFPGLNPPAERAFDNFGKTGGRDALSPPAAASSDFGNKFRPPAAETPYQRPSPFLNSGPSAFGSSDPSKQRVQPLDFEALKKRLR
jgi:hypothetical protein